MDLVLKLTGLAYLFFAFFDLRRAVLFLPAFFPLYLLKFEVFGVPFPLVEVFIYASFLAWGVRTVVAVVQKKMVFTDVFQPFKNRVWIPVAALLLAAVFSTVITPNSVVMIDGTTLFYGRKVALGILKSWIFAPVLMFFLFNVVMRSAKEREIALTSYVVSSLFLAGWGIYQVLTKNYLTIDERASGPFNSANYLALYITPALFYAITRGSYFWNTEEGLSQKVTTFLFSLKKSRTVFFYVLFWFLASVLLFFGLLFTKSYAAFLAFFIVLMLFFRSLLRMSGKISGKVVLLFFGLIFAIVVALIVLDPVKWQTFFQWTTRTSSGVRVEIYAIAMRLVRDHPFLGIGLGMFPVAYQLEGVRYLGHLPYELNMLHPHNIFLAFWLNLGLIGFMSFLWILKLCFQKVWKLICDFPALEFGSIPWFRAVSLGMLLIMLIHGLVDTPFFKNDLALLFWLFVALQHKEGE